MTFLYPIRFAMQSFRWTRNCKGLWICSEPSRTEEAARSVQSCWLHVLLHGYIHCQSEGASHHDSTHSVLFLLYSRHVLLRLSPWAAMKYDDTKIFVQAVLAQNPYLHSLILQVSLAKLAVLLILQVALAKMENLDIAWQNSSYSQGCVWNSLGHLDNERLNPSTAAL